MTQLYLVRHGETAWSKSGQHTSITDLELTPKGVEDAKSLASRLDPAEFGLVLTSPRTRARETARLAGFPDAEVDENLAEWFYGEYEGMTSAQIRETHPGWRIWFDRLPGGETHAQVVARLNRVINRVRESGVDKAICFAHGHSLRVLALDWLGISISYGASFPLNTGSVSVVGYEKETPAIIRWNS